MAGTFEIIGEHYRWHRATSEIEDTRDGTRRSDSDYSAKVDVYEDRVRWWFLEIAKAHTTNGVSRADYVALAIGLWYVEGVEQYRCGNGATGQSEARFKASVQRIFSGVADDVAVRLYKAVRCGLFHSGFTEGPTFVSHDRPPAIDLAEERYLNPAAFIRSAADDFTRYVGELRAHPEGQLGINFVKLWDKRWNETEVGPH